MAELVERSGVARATIKYYLREGLLPSGRASGATQADYGEEHLRRLRLVRTLVETVGLSLSAVRRVVRAADAEDDDRYAALGQALGALPPHAEDVDPTLPRARAALAVVGQEVDPTYPPTAQLERALSDLEAAGMPVSEDLLTAYGRHLRPLAEIEVAGISTDGRPSVERAVLGTVLHEPLVLALRRLLQQDVARARTSDQ